MHRHGIEHLVAEHRASRRPGRALSQLGALQRTRHRGDAFTLARCQRPTELDDAVAHVGQPRRGEQLRRQQPAAGTELGDGASLRRK
jgi:hypothetical protein